jgi:membrane-bound ClpP family serine protease
MPDAGILATVLLVAGLFLLGLEFFIPSFGMILVIASISLIVSFWSACKAWWGVNPYFFWTYVVMLTAGIPGSLVVAITIIQKTSLGNRMILPPASSSDVLSPNPLETMIGKRGVSQTLMTPGGIVTIGSERFHAESPGMLIEPRTPVIVIGAKASRIVVRPLTSADDQPHSSGVQPNVTAVSLAAGTSQTVTTAEPDPLDFEIPEDYTPNSENV